MGLRIKIELIFLKKNHSILVPWFRVGKLDNHTTMDQICILI
jgi:hypothetical protein